MVAKVLTLLLSSRQRGSRLYFKGQIMSMALKLSFLIWKRSIVKGLGWALTMHVGHLMTLVVSFPQKSSDSNNKGFINKNMQPILLLKKPIFDLIGLSCNRFQGKIITILIYYHNISIYFEKKIFCFHLIRPNNASPKTFNNLNNSDILCRQHKLRQLV